MNSRWIGLLLVLGSTAGLLWLRTAPAQEMEPALRQVIVKWREPNAVAAKSSAASLALRDAEARVGASATALRVTASGAEVLRLNRALSKAEATQFLATLKDNPHVEYAEEDLLLRTDMTPNDPLYAEQWHLQSSTAGMRLPAAWDMSTGRDVYVAVFDTGHTLHRDGASTLGQWDFVSDPQSAGDGDGRDFYAGDPGDLGMCTGDTSTWHGTLVAGIINARTNNGRGVAGVAFDAVLSPVRVMGRCNTGWLSDLADAIVWSAGIRIADPDHVNPLPTKILNISLGAAGACPTELQRAINSVRSRGLLVIASAGNEGRDVATHTPANCTGVLAVAAVKRNGSKTDDSNFGEGVGLAAPGGDGSSVGNRVLSTGNAGTTVPGAEGYLYLTGTSAAAANVTGVAALVWSRTPSLTADEVAATLRETARPFPGVCAKCGMGLVDAAAAVAADRSRRPLPPASISANPTRSSTGNYTITWSAPAGTTHYWIERAAPASWGGLTRLTGTSRSYTDQPSGEYRHRVRACNANGCSGWTTGNLVTVCNPQCE
jgi:serine protease